MPPSELRRISDVLSFRSTKIGRTGISEVNLKPGLPLQAPTGRSFDEADRSGKSVVSEVIKVKVPTDNDRDESKERYYYKTGLEEEEEENVEKSEARKRLLTSKDYIITTTTTSTTTTTASTTSTTTTSSSTTASPMFMNNDQDGDGMPWVPSDPFPILQQVSQVRLHFFCLSSVMVI
jgi:hypothetical protein